MLANDEAKDSLRLVVIRHDYKVDKNEDAIAQEIIKMQREFDQITEQAFGDTKGAYEILDFDGIIVDSTPYREFLYVLVKPTEDA